MNRSIAFICLSLIGLSLRSETVDPEVAQASARSFLARRGVVMTETSSPYKAPRRGKRNAEAPAYYVFNIGQDKGYVIISADSRTKEVLAYVDHGRFDEQTLDDNVRSFLQTYADEIQLLDDNGVTESDVRKAPRKVTYTRHTVSPLIKAKWGQGEPYNLMVPMIYNDSGELFRPVTGCVATAFAQVLSFFRYPAETKKMIPARTLKYTIKNGDKAGQTLSVSQPAIPAGTKIDWDNILDTYSGKEDSVQNYAVANLMNMCGSSVNMAYSAGGSAAALSNSVGAIKNYFGYNECARWAHRDNYDLEAWTELLYDELAAGYPFPMQGFSSGGGHSFVIDGFDGEGLFHVNFGWSGSSNGWYQISSLQPGANAGEGASSSADGYTRAQAVLINIRYPDDEPVTQPLRLNVTATTCRVSTARVTFKNDTGTMGTFVTGIVVWDEDAQDYLPVGVTKSITSFATGATRDMTFTLNNLLPEGTHYLSPASHYISEKQWIPAYNLRREYILATVDSTGNTRLEYQKDQFELTGEITFPGNRQVGRRQPVNVTFQNSGAEYEGMMHLYAGINGEKVYQECRMHANVPQNGSTTLNFNFTPKEEGTYDVWICGENENIELAHSTVAITEDGVANVLSVSAVNIQNKANNTIYGSQLYGTITVRNKMDVTFNGNIKVAIWGADPNNAGIMWYVGSQNIKFDIGPSKSGTGSFKFNNVTNGRRFCIVVSYVDQDGFLENGQKWVHWLTTSPGVIYWQNSGSVGGAAGQGNFVTPKNAAGVYLQKAGIVSLTPNNLNPNTIYSLSKNEPMPEIKTTLNHVNLVQDNKADTVVLQSGYAYYAQADFQARHAEFIYTLPNDYDGMGWRTIMLPFVPQSISVDNVEYQLGEEDVPFWIYEFTHEDKDRLPVFQPTTSPIGRVPYLISADASMAGKTIIFKADDVLICGANDITPVVSGQSNRMYSHTVQKTAKGVYYLNSVGTAFNYTSLSKTIDPMSAYFMSLLPDSERPKSIPLPTVPTLTGIKTVKPTETKVQSIYDLSGRRVDNPKNGLFIVNGKKVLIK